MIESAPRDMNIIRVNYHDKTRKLRFQFPFHLADIARSFPAKRFDPKLKVWNMPLTKGNIAHINQTRQAFKYEFSEAAEDAIANHQDMAARPKLVDFPTHLYDFKRSKTGYLPLKHQERMLNRAWNFPAIAWVAKMGCVTGDTELQVLLCSKSRKMTIEQLYRTRSKEIKARAFKADRFGQHGVIEVLQSGIKEVCRLTLSCGKVLKATPDHPILTPDGFVELAQLSIGESVVTTGGKVIVHPYLSRVVSIESVGEEMTYDLSMEHPYHNYVANGIVVHNTGKTFAAIHLACARFEANLIDAVVVICPATLRTTWMKELVKYATIPYEYEIHATKSLSYSRFEKDRTRESMQILGVSVEGLGISTASYDSVCGYFVGRRVMIIVDESSRIKTPNANRTKRVLALRDASVSRIILNGTPIALGIQDLWSQFEFLDPNIIGMGDYYAFKARYMVMGGYEQRQVVGSQNVEELMAAIEPYTVEVGKDVLDLPPKVSKVRFTQASPEQKKLLKLIKKGNDESDGEIDIKVSNALEKNLRYRQVVGGWLPKYDPLTEKTTLVLLDDNPKMNDLMQMIDDNFAGSKFIIWSSFIHEIEYIANHLKGKYGERSTRIYYGKTDQAERSVIEDRYCNDPDLRFLIGNPATAGLGITLISGENDIMVYYTGTDAYIDRAQSEDRAHRIGQKNTVVVVDMIMEKTIDEVTLGSNAAKCDIETYIMNRMKMGYVDPMTG